MIPKVIHYCWFGKKEKDFLTKCYIDSWKMNLSDYKFIEWNEENSPIGEVDFAKEAYASRNYAFVADYVRIYALYHHGGIYFDTDVLVLKTFDPYLSHKAFSCFETKNNNLIGTAVLGCEPQNELIGTFLNYYNSHHFNNDGNLDRLANTFILRMLLEPYGLICNNKKQILSNGFVIYPRTYFSAKINISNALDITECTVCIHNFAESWISPKRKLKKRVLNFLSYLKIRKIMKKWR